MREVCGSFKAELKEFNGEADHIPLLIHYPPEIALSKLINTLKGVSSRYLRAEYTGRINRIGTGSVFWPRAYVAASCGGAPRTVIRQYIEQQKRPLQNARQSSLRMRFPPRLKPGIPTQDQRWSLHRCPGELPQVNQPLDSVGDPDEDAERDQLGDLARQFLPHRDGVGEYLKRVRPHGFQGQSGLQIPCVELEKLA